MLRRIAAALALVAAAYVILLAAPYPLFGWQTTFHNITIYSDQPMPDVAASVIHDAENRLSRSPLYDPLIHRRIFICNSNGRFTFFTTYQNRVGGLNYALLNGNIFLRRSNFERNRLIGYSGNEVPDPRTLAYFIAHEITHSLEAEYLGRYAYWRLPEWKREGYADVVGKAGDFDFRTQLAAFQRDEPTLDPRASGLYLRYELLASYLLDRKGISPQALLSQPFDSGSLENELRAK